MCFSYYSAQTNHITRFDCFHSGFSVKQPINNDSLYLTTQFRMNFGDLTATLVDMSMVNICRKYVSNNKLVISFCDPLLYSLVMKTIEWLRTNPNMHNLSCRNFLLFFYNVIPNCPFQQHLHHFTYYHLS